VRRPRLDYESHATGLDRNEVGAMLVAAGLSNPRDHALISLLALNGLRLLALNGLRLLALNGLRLLALNGLRVSEALGADIEDLRARARPAYAQHRA
jgi:integrase